ncbi:MAG TPA: diaminopimelate decarboxylase [Candidatus Polarisedimenticolaceae bacterium]|nr:diaminopimelate decarboxylase [Candidatus Polarisedimenticolaceae bacterium]
MIVSKFGGTSVADREAIGRLTGIVRGRREKGVLVVVSALAGISDALVGALDAALEGDLGRARSLVAAIAERHRTVLREVGGTPDDAASVEALLAEIEEIATGIILVKDATPWTRARFVGAGELLSSRIVAAALASAGLEPAWLDAREVVRTAGTDPERDPPDTAAIVRRVRERWEASWAGRVAVTQGFIGSASGTDRPTLLGRGGSDYSASLLGAVLSASRVEIWTDVDGVLTAHPKVVPGARRVKQLSFAEASELAYFGAKVLHPATLLPAVEAKVPVWVGNARRPDGEGTTILPEGVRAKEARYAVKAIADKRGITVVHVVSSRMLMAHGFLARIFAVFDAHRTAVDLIATSEVSVSLTIDDASRLDAIVSELASFARVEVQRNMAVVCLVGEGMQGSASVTAEALRVLERRPVRLITQGASAINLSVVLPEDEVTSAVRDLHDAFFRGPLPAEIFGEPARAAAPPAEAPLPAGGRDGLLAIARREGTPAYVYDLDVVGSRIETLRRALPGRLLYACKANAHPEILERLAREGVGVEAASPGEVVRALECGHRAEDVLLSATNARASDLVSIAERGCPLALGSIADVEKLGRAGIAARVLLRINPGTGAGHHRHVVTGGATSKFGIALSDLDEALAKAKGAGLNVIGLHAHGGSGVGDPQALLAAADALLDAARRLPEVRVLDFGGGFGIPYRENEPELDVVSYGRELKHRLDGLAWEAWFEPGRFLVGPAGVLLATVTTRKTAGGHVFIGLDTGMNHLIRPALYGAYHRIVNLTAPEAPLEPVEIVGNVCESTDVFASARLLPRAEEGHVLAILDAGAYGMAMASAYCLWPLPKEVVVATS